MCVEIGTITAEKETLIPSLPCELTLMVLGVKWQLARSTEVSAGFYFIANWNGLINIQHSSVALFPAVEAPLFKV